MLSLLVGQDQESTEMKVIPPDVMEVQSAQRESIVEEKHEQGISDSDEHPSPYLGLNPFLLPEIATNVIRYINNVMTLLNCRATSQMWKTEATKFMRKTYVVELETVQQVSDYYSAMHKSDDFPHEIFNLGLLVLKDLKTDDAMVLNSFITTFGPSIKHLKLSLNEKLSSPNDWWTFLYNCNNLEKLSVSLGRDFTYDFGPGDGGITLFQEVHRGYIIRDHRHIELAAIRSGILNVPPFLYQEPVNPLYGPIAPRLQLNIQHFHVSFEGVSGSLESISKFFRTIFHECALSLVSISCSTFHTDIYLGNILFNSLCSTAVELGGGFDQLRELNFWFKPTNEQLKDLSRFHSLTSLKMVLGNDIRNDTFTGAISPCSSTLERFWLVVKSSAFFSGTFPVPIRMPRLKHLNLFGYNALSLEFLRNAPYLEEMSVLGISLNVVTEEIPRYRSNCSLKHLHVLRSDGCIDISTVSKITDCFHEIVSLELSNVTNETLDTIYQTMPNLQELKVSGAFTDEGICGIPERSCQEIEELQVHFIVDDTMLRKYVFIGCLSKLKRLTIKSDLITDISVMFGLARIQNLDDLVISGELITERSAESICNSMVLETVDVSGCKNLHETLLSKVYTQSWMKDLLYRKKVTSNSSSDEFINQLLQFDHKQLTPVFRQGILLPNEHHYNLMQIHVGIVEMENMEMNPHLNADLHFQLFGDFEEAHIGIF